MLEVRLLGQFELRVDGAVRTLPSRPAQGLLAYLALRAGVAQRRERLAGLLWPDHTDDSARRNLRTALWHVRKVLGDGKADGNAYILADGITTAFNAGSEHWIDVTALEAAVDADCTASELIELVSLYQGELLPGFYDEWVLLERDRVEAVFEALMQRLLGQLLVEERWRDTVAWATRWLSFGHAPELAHRALMLAHAGLGDRPSLAEVFSRCRAALTGELGVEPSSQTSALYASLLAGDPPGALLAAALPLPHPHPAAGASPPVAAAAAAAEEPAPGDPPYRGLRYFSEEDAALFFGREALVRALLERLAADPSLLVVVGASGSGKSSLVRAGLTAELRKMGSAESSAGMGSWRVRILTPGPQPLTELAACVAERPGEAVHEAANAMRADHLALTRRVQQSLQGTRDRLLLVVDQFEELFTLCQDEAERRAFVDNLVAAAQAGIPLTAIVALRADFYAHCGQYPALREALASRQAYIGPMNAAELRRAIEEPAQRGGWEFSPGLVDLILRDAGDEPGRLPLLSHALLETWKRRQGRTLTLSGYAAAGGVTGAVARTAQWVYQGLRTEEQAIARSAFLRLTALGEGTQDTRRRVAMVELIPVPESANLVRNVLEALADARLVTISDDGVEVAHEALIREWPALRRWLAEDREGLRLHRRITAASQEWESLGRDPSVLFRATRLQQAVEWAESHDDQLNAAERAFLDAARAAAAGEAQEREAQRQRELEASRQLARAESERAEAERRAANRVRVAMRSLAVARKQAEAQRRLATARELAAAAVACLAGDSERSILLAVEAINSTYAADGTWAPEAEAALHQAIHRSRVIRTLLPPHADDARAVAFSPDGRRIVAGFWSGAAHVWDAATGERVAELRGHAGSVNGVAFSPGGALIATASDDRTVRLWDAIGRHERTLTGHTSFVDRVTFDPRGTCLATSGSDGTLIVWDAQSGAVRHRFRTSGGAVCPLGVAFSPDGRLVAGGGPENTTRIWDVATGQERAVLTGHGDLQSYVSFSRDGSRLVTASMDQTAKIWDIASGRELVSFENHTNLLSSAIFHPDDRAVLTASYDGTARLWDAARGRELAVFAGHEKPLGEAAFSPDGSRVATAGEDGSVRIWSAQPRGELAALQVPGAGPFGPFAIDLSPDGRLAAVAGDGGDLTLLDLAAAKVLWTMPVDGEGRPQFDVSFSPDGRRVVVGGQGLQAGVWDVATGERVLALEGHAGPVLAGDWMFVGIQGVDFSPDGRLIATAGADGTARTWDAATGEPRQVLEGHGARLNSVRFSRDGTLLVTGADDNNAKVWEVASGRALVTLEGHGSRVKDAAFSPDAARVATASRDALVKVWDARGGRLLLTLAGHTSTANGVAFSPDGSRLASASADATVRIWDATSGAELLTLNGENAAARSPVFSADGKRLAVVYGNGAGYIYALDMDELLRMAGERVTRALTAAECRQYLHREECVRE